MFLLCHIFILAFTSFPSLHALLSLMRRRRRRRRKLSQQIVIAEPGKADSCTEAQPSSSLKQKVDSFALTIKNIIYNQNVSYLAIDTNRKIQADYFLYDMNRTH